MFLTILFLSNSLFSAELSFEENAVLLQHNLPKYTNYKNSSGETFSSSITISSTGEVELKQKSTSNEREITEKITFKLSDFKNENDGLRFQAHCWEDKDLKSEHCELTTILNSEAYKIKVESIGGSNPYSEMDFTFTITFISKEFARSFANAFANLVKLSPN